MTTSTTGVWVDTRTGAIVTSAPVEGIVLVAPGREITAAVASRISAAQTAGTGGTVALERQSARANYSFGALGGAVGDITLSGDTVPAGAIVLDAYVDVTTALTSGGSATVAIKVEGAADINAADAISGAPWSTTGAKRADFGASTAPIKTTAARSIVATVGTAALTAGAFTVVIEYVELG